MKDEQSQYPDTPAMSRRASSGWKMVVLVITGLMALGLIIVAIGAFKSRPSVLPPSLSISANDLQADAKTGKLVWNGTVTNNGRTEVDAPWVKVTIYNPDGDSIDSGDATTAVPTIAAGGSLAYSTTFDTRGTNLRPIPVLELPNSRALGM